MSLHDIQIKMDCSNQAFRKRRLYGVQATSRQVSSPDDLFNIVKVKRCKLLCTIESQIDLINN
jgi:hypothetical protein